MPTEVAVASISLACSKKSSSGTAADGAQASSNGVPATNALAAATKMRYVFPPWARKVAEGRSWVPEIRRSAAMASPVKTSTDDAPRSKLNRQSPSAGAVQRCQTLAARAPNASPGSVVAPTLLPTKLPWAALKAAAAAKSSLPGRGACAQLRVMGASLAPARPTRMRWATPCSAKNVTASGLEATVSSAAMRPPR